MTFREFGKDLFLDFTRTESSVVSEPVVVVLEKKSEEMNSVYTAKIDVIAIQLSTKKKFDYFLESVFEGTVCNLKK